MSRQATIVLDSGLFLEPLEKEENPYRDVGYFESEGSEGDLNLYVDGEAYNSSQPIRLGNGNARVEVTHTRADGRPQSGTTMSQSLKQHLLRRKDLYDGVEIAVDEASFDFIIRFNSGHFCCSMVKKRTFKEHLNESDGTHKFTGTGKTIGPIAHNVVIHYDLEDGDVLKLVREGETLWSSDRHPDAKRRFDIEFVADNSTATKFYSEALKLAGGNPCWLPNQGDPPPMGTP